MNEQEEVNPYATPQSECLLHRPPEESVKRPASVKWALALMLGSVVFISILEAQLFGEHGWSLWTNHPWAAATDASRIATCFALLFGGRAPWVFVLTALQLSMHLINFGEGVILGSPALPAHDFASQIAFYFIGGLLCYHFYRFTFGLPSRSYFGMSKVK